VVMAHVRYRKIAIRVMKIVKAKSAVHATAPLIVLDNALWKVDVFALVATLDPIASTSLCQCKW
jgi:hypothetical protein